MKKLSLLAGGVFSSLAMFAEEGTGGTDAGAATIVEGVQGVITDYCDTLTPIIAAVVGLGLAIGLGYWGIKTVLRFLKGTSK